MYKFILVLTVIFYTTFSSAAESDDADGAVPKPIIVTAAQKAVTQFSIKLLSKYHYLRKMPENFSKLVLDEYLSALDFSHIYFLQSDIDEFSRYHDDLFRQSSEGDLTLAIKIFERYRQRATDLNTWTLNRLKQPFNLKSDDQVMLPNYTDKKQNTNWYKSIDEVHAYQEKRLTDALIRLVLSKRTQEKALETLTSRYTNAQKQLNIMDSDDVFNIYINAITASYDPHSSYLSPQDTEDFNINMRLALDGIGATLSYEDEKITIRDLVPGGPAYKSGKLHIKDHIIGVAEGKNGPMKDIIGVRTDKAVRLIRGKKGTVVRLLIEPANATESVREVTLVRDTVKLEEQAAQAYVESIEVDGLKQQLGVIRLPSFYSDFESARMGNKNFRSTSKDMAKLLRDLKAKHVEGILIDLRGNGGGSLSEVVQTVGLFIDKGPVVMVSDSEGAVRVEKDTDAGMLYDGPLAVMVDNYSASASEIFAAAIQDYKRGLIIGNNTYGKGTVQNLIELNKFVPKSTPNLGEMKFTIAMFYRITGDSTQIRGVKPDIALPNISDLDEVGERSEPRALAYKRIPPADFVAYQDVNPHDIAVLQAQHEQRMQTLPALKKYAEFIARQKHENDKTNWSLNLDVRKSEYTRWKQYKKQYESFAESAITPLNADEKHKKDIEARNAATTNEADKETFIPDIGLYEGLNILFDYLQLHQNDAKAA